MHRGWHFLQIPGPSNTPQRVLKAIQSPTMDHRGPEFGEITRGILPKVRTVFGTSGEVIIYPSSGTGAWEAALVNALSPGDKCVMVETGHFASLWAKLAAKFDLVPEVIETDWRRGADPNLLEDRLRADGGHECDRGEFSQTPHLRPSAGSVPLESSACGQGGEILQHPRSAPGALPTESVVGPPGLEPSAAR